MTTEDYWSELLDRFGISPMSKGQGKTVICNTPNQTIFVLPDPDELRTDQERQAVFNFVVANLATFVMPS